MRMFCHFNILVLSTKAWAAILHHVWLRCAENRRGSPEPSGVPSEHNDGGGSWWKSLLVEISAGQRQNSFIFTTNCSQNRHTAYAENRNELWKTFKGMTSASAKKQITFCCGKNDSVSQHPELIGIHCGSCETPWPRLDNQSLCFLGAAQRGKTISKGKSQLLFIVLLYYINTVMFFCFTFGPLDCVKDYFLTLRKVPLMPNP